MNGFDELLNGLHSTTIAEAAVLVREVRVRVGVLSRPVTIRIYYDNIGDEPFRFALSAFMKTARESEPYDEPRRCASEAEALRRAVRMLTRDYEDAVRRGELPHDDWLVDGDRI